MPPAAGGWRGGPTPAGLIRAALGVFFSPSVFYIYQINGAINAKLAEPFLAALGAAVFFTIFEYL